MDYGVPRMSSERDPELSAALRALDVPEHAPGFWDDLRTELTPAPVPLAPRRHWKRNTLRAVTVAAAVAVLAVSAGVLGGGPDGPDVASATEVGRRTRAALAAAGTLRGELVYRDGDGAGDRTRFVISDRGDLRLDTTTASRDVLRFTYNAATGEERGFTDAAGAEPAYASIRTGLAPTQTPDPGPVDWIFQRTLSATLRAGLGDQPAVVTTYEGRPAWVIEADVVPNAIAGPGADHVQATIDQATALPLRIVETRAGVLVRELAVAGLTAGGPPTAAELTLALPPGVEPERTDVGFRRVALADVEARAGYRPLVPGALPDGFELSEVAVADSAGPTGTEGLNPPSRDVVSLLYRRGFDTVLVTTRRRTAPAGHPTYPQCTECLPGTAWADPMASGEGFVDAPEPFAAAAGALAGQPARLLIRPEGTAPHIWGVTAELVVTVSGDMSRSELSAVAESLATYAG